MPSDDTGRWIPVGIFFKEWSKLFFISNDFSESFIKVLTFFYSERKYSRKIKTPEEESIGLNQLFKLENKVRWFQTMLKSTLNEILHSDLKGNSIKTSSHYLWLNKHHYQALLFIKIFPLNSK